VSTGTIDFDFVKDIKFKAKLPEGPIPLLLAGAWCLAAKLVARESNQVEAVFVVFIVQRPQSGVVNILQGSFTGNVNNYQHLALIL